MSIIPIPSGLQTRQCVIGNDVLPEIPALLRSNWPGDTRPVRIVADTNTWRVAGQRVQELLQAAGFVVDAPVIFPGSALFHAEYKYVELLREPLAGHLPVSVGSGTINDLVKRTTEELKLDGYLSCATAGSVDGYTSAGAAITKDGFKQTLPCAAPLVIVADNAVVRTAPFPMTAAGYADLAAKVPAGGDWLIADAVGATPLHPVVWPMVQEHLREWLEAPEKLLAGDATCYANLFNGLCQTGFAMQYMKDSRPASGAEHLYSHIWEMRDIRKDGIQPSHGFKVAVGSLVTTALMEEVFFHSTVEELRQWGAEAPELTPERRNAQIDQCLKGTTMETGARQVALAKLLTGDALRQRRKLLYAKHAELAAKLRTQLLPFEELRRRFALLGCPTTFEEIGLNLPEWLEYTTLAAGMIRNRYTILDVLTELNITSPILERVAKRLASNN